jgi:PAS domain S-box-containing protein
VEIVRDVTDHKQAEETLRASENYLEEILNSIFTGVIVVDEKTHEIVDANPNALEAIGASKEHIIGKVCHRFICPAERGKCPISDLRQTIDRSERVLLRADGKRIPILKTVKTMMWRGHKYLLESFIDITERKRVEEALRESEERLRSIFASSPNAITVADLNGNIIECNQATLDLHGFSSKEELIGKSALELIAKKEQQRAIEDLKKILERGLFKNIEYTLLTKDGREFSAELSASVIKDSLGNPTGLVAISKDITERKKMEEALRESEEKYRMQFEEALDAIFLADAETGIIIDCNRAASELVGREKSELVGKHQRILHPPEEFEEQFSRTFKQHLKEKEGQVLETHVITKRGEIKDVAIKANVIELRGKKLIQGIFRDITKKKKAEEALRESEEKYRELINGMNETAWVIDFDGKFIDVNDAAVKVLGYSREELLSMGPQDIDTSLDVEEIRDLIKRMPTDEIQIFETTHTTKDGKTIPVEISSSLVTYQGKHAILSIARDITERKKAEKALHRSESKYRTLLENIPQKIFFKDKNLVYVSCNENYARDLKIKPNEITGKTDYDFFPKELAEKYRVDDQRIMKSWKTEDIEEEYVQDGHKIFVHTIKTPVKDENGNVVGILGIFWDVTERKKAEERIRESEEKYRNLFENARDIIATFDLKGNATSINKAVMEYGFKENDIIGKNMRKFVPKKYWPRLLKDLMNIARGNPNEGELEIITPRGKKIVEYRSNPMRDEKKVVGFQTILRDVTERKEMEEKLRQYSENLEELVRKRTEELLESETRLAILVEDAIEGVVIVQDQKIIFANKKIMEILGYPVNELIGLSLKQFIEKLVDKKYHESLSEIYTIKHGVDKIQPTYEFELISKNGQHTPVEISASVVHYENFDEILILLRDVKERKQAEEQRLRLERLTALGELATMVGHDLRNPMQSIENATYYLNNELSNLSASVPISQTTTEMLQVINNSVNYADRIIRDLQDFSAKKKPRLEKTDINAIVKEAVSQVQIPENVKLITELDHLPRMKADKDHMKRVFTNLTTNAVEAMRNGGTLTVSTKKTDSFVEISFRDTGEGISKENMDKLFTPFFTTKAKGMGIGLSICKKFVESHGGSIEVETKEGKGSTFRIKLPLTQEKGGENP